MYIFVARQFCMYAFYTSVFQYLYLIGMDMHIHTCIQLLNIKKFLQKIHSTHDVGVKEKEGRGEPRPPRKLWLSPDIFLECEDIILQITDDPFEVKLKANYEVHVHVHVHQGLLTPKGEEKAC